MLENKPFGIKTATYLSQAYGKSTFGIKNTLIFYPKESFSETLG